MRDNAPGEALLMRYLLGDLPEEEQVEIEERAFRDQQLLRDIQAVESDLIDEYVTGGLTDRERLQFEARFFASSERRGKVAFARALTIVAPEFALAEDKVRPSIASEPANWRTALANLLSRLAPAAKFALAAAALLVLVGASWLAVEALRLRFELRAAQQARQNSEQALQQQLADERALRDQIATRLQGEQQQLERSEQLLRELEREQESAARAPRPTIVSLALISGVPRSGAARPRLALSHSASLARLQVEIEPTDEYKSFRVDLRSGARQIWTRDNLSARTFRGARSVVVNVPASILEAGEYELALKGLTGDGRVDQVGYYYFDVLKK